MFILYLYSLIKSLHFFFLILVNLFYQFLSVFDELFNIILILYLWWPFCSPQTQSIEDTTRYEIKLISIAIYFRFINLILRSDTDDSWNRRPETVCGVLDIPIRSTIMITNCTAEAIQVRSHYYII